VKPPAVWHALTCTCGWTHDATTRPSAIAWKRYHREQYQRPGERLADGGHVVAITRRPRERLAAKAAK
jgi:hypothetical protein